MIFYQSHRVVCNTPEYECIIRSKGHCEKGRNYFWIYLFFEIIRSWAWTYRCEIQLQYFTLKEGIEILCSKVISRTLLPGLRRHLLVQTIFIANWSSSHKLLTWTVQTLSSKQYHRRWICLPSLSPAQLWQPTGVLLELVSSTRPGIQSVSSSSWSSSWDSKLICESSKYSCSCKSYRNLCIGLLPGFQTLCIPQVLLWSPSRFTLVNGLMMIIRRTLDPEYLLIESESPL